MSHIQLNERFLYYPDTLRQGGTAEVYEGVDLNNRGDKVALKILKDVLVTKELADLAFERETKCLSRLNHRNIVKWVDAGRDPKTGRRFFASEWLDAQLREHLQVNQVVGWDQFYVDYAKPLLDALKYAFEQGVIHRDIKPSNVMVGTDGSPKLVDFGIASFHQTPQIGHTLASFRSVPFSPPEDLTNEPSRDVWGYAATCIACFNDSDLQDYSALARELDEFDAPPEIHEIFSKALANIPADRYISILDFAADLESAQRKRESHFAPFLEIPVRITVSTFDRMKQYYPRADQSDLQKRILNDLNGQIALQVKASPTPDVELPDIEIVANEHQYICSVDRETESFLVIKGAMSILPYYADRFREEAYCPHLKFVLVDRANGLTRSTNIATLVAEIADQKVRIEAQKEKGNEEKFFNTWRDVLRLKAELADSQQRLIRYHASTLLGRRADLQCDDLHDVSIIGERRAIHLTSGYQIRGEIEDVNGSHITIYFDERPVDGIPESGTLAADNAATKFAIDRQKSAIDAIRYGRNVGSLIRPAIVSPSLQGESIHCEIKTFAFSDLDPAKRAAVSKGLAENPITLIQGPPGTGKTQLIVELIFQLIARSPSVRILLSSQTHIALDNVLERLIGILPSVNAVRVGRVSDRNKSALVASLMIEEIAQRWMSESSQKSKQFLDQWGTSRSISVEDIHLGRAVSRNVASQRETSKLRESVKKLQEEISELERQLDLPEEDSQGATVFERREALLLLKDEVEEVQRQRRGAEQRGELTRRALIELGEDGRTLSKLEIEDLCDWEKELLGTDDKDMQFRQMLDLAEEWQLRFASAKELYPAILSCAQVVAGTCIGFAGARGVLDVEFDVCIIDEASKATASELCVPMSRANRVVLVGDHKQLPPFIEDGLLKKNQLERFDLSRDDVLETLFERLYRKLPESHKVMLTKQYRMLPAIGNLVSHCFYDDALSSAERLPMADLVLAGIPKPVTWVSTSMLEKRHDQWCAPGYKNVLEAEVIRDMLRPLNLCLTKEDLPWRIALLTGYTAQREELARQANLVISDIEQLQIEFGTVDSFQGRQARIAIFSVTRSNVKDEAGFLTEIRRLNVALSRAQEALVIVGDLQFALGLSITNPLRRVADYVCANVDTCAVRELEP